MLKKSVQDFFSSFRRGTCPRLAPFFKHLRVRKMAVGPSTAPQVAEKRVFQQPASTHDMDVCGTPPMTRNQGAALSARPPLPPG
jgi:hypothetical protein